MSDFRKIRKMGINFEQYREELTPQDMAFLTRN
jgi:hypothetical protein